MVNVNAIRRNPKRFIKQTKDWFGSSALLLYVLPLLAIPATIKALMHGNLLGIIVNAGGYTAYLLAAHLLKRGLQAERVYQDKRVARAPKWPLKTVASMIVAVTTFGMAWLGGGNTFLVSTAFGVGALLGMSLCYGLDPRAAKSILGDHGYSIEEINHTIEQAENVIRSIEHANDKIRNLEFNNRIDQICATARQIVDDLEANPSAIRRARKFLLVYLDGADKVANGYANTHTQVEAQELEQNFRNVLDNLDEVFKEQRQRLLQEDLFDLDVQMEVLVKQLKHEGII